MSGEQTMKIEKVKTYVVANPSPIRGGPYWVFVKLLTDDGLAGFGEAFWVPLDPRMTARLIEDVGERLVVGANPFDNERLWRTLYSSGYAQHPDLTMMGVISAFDMACWDIVGKALNQPIYNLLGGKYHERLRSRRRTATSWNGSPASPPSPSPPASDCRPSTSSASSWRSRRRRSSRWRSAAWAGSSRRRRSPGWPRPTTPRSRRTCGPARSRARQTSRSTPAAPTS